MRISLLLVGLLLAGAATPARADAASVPVTGTWQALLPDVITSFEPSGADPTKGAFTAVGSTLWNGSWTGVTTYTVRGTIDLVTNANSGTLAETFTGGSSAAGSGTIDLTETFLLDATGHLTIRTSIVAGSGDFQGSHGRVDFDGHMISIATGSGTYNGRWLRPRGTQ